MKSFKERMMAKMKESGITSSQFLDNLTEAFCETIKHETTEELREDLIECGIDPDKCVAKTLAIVEKYKRKHRMQELKDQGLSLADIGRHYAVTRQRVWQILNRR